MDASPLAPFGRSRRRRETAARRSIGENPNSVSSRRLVSSIDPSRSRAREQTIDLETREVEIAKFEKKTRETWTMTTVRLAKGGSETIVEDVHAFPRLARERERVVYDLEIESRGLETHASVPRVSKSSQETTQDEHERRSSGDADGKTRTTFVLRDDRDLAPQSLRIGHLDGFSDDVVEKVRQRVFVVIARDLLELRRERAQTNANLVDERPDVGVVADLALDETNEFRRDGSVREHAERVGRHVVAIETLETWSLFADGGGRDGGVGERVVHFFFSE